VAKSAKEKIMLEFAFNSYNPRKRDAKSFVISQNAPEEKKAILWSYVKKWSQEFVVGEPEATEKYTTEQLKQMGYVGFYRKNNSVVDKILGDHGSEINDTSAVPPLFAADEPDESNNEK
jgi:hypothetical protein